MIMDWLTAAGLISALAAAVAIGIVDRRGKQTRQPRRTAPPPSFRAHAARDFRSNLEYPYRGDLRRKRASAKYSYQ
jgi:hypothetical protein